MKSKTLLIFALLALIPLSGAAPLLLPGDPIIAFDSDTPGNSRSDYPSDDSPLRAIDGRIDTKYGNGGKLNSGFIVTPATAVAVQSFVITTAIDFPAADPASWQIFGTNDPITSTDNSDGEKENWTLISEGTFDPILPAARQTEGAAVGFPNTDAWKSYRMVFPTVKDAGTAVMMHFSEIQFYPNEDGTGTNVLAPGNAIKAIQIPVPGASSSPANEEEALAIDGLNNTKYLNFGKLNTGFIVTPSSGAQVVKSFRITTANDADVRDPASYDIYGTNDDILSEDNSAGDQENWTFIASGTLALPAGRNTLGPVVSFANTTAYKSWRVTFPTVKNATTANSMQLAEFQFFTAAAGTGTGVITPGDPIVAVLVPKSQSTYRTNNEKPANLLDGLTTTKYVNFAERNAGFIVTPASGPAAVQSFVLTTANDFPERDPAGYELYGTNAPVLSLDNSNGEAEAWTLVARGSLALPAARQTAAPVVGFPNTTAYSSWKWVTTSVKNPTAANSMQLAEVKFFPNTNGTGTAVLSAADRILAIHKPVSASSAPPNEEALNVLDGNTGTKYLNFGKKNTGFIVTPAAGAQPITGLSLTTANDGVERDPAVYTLSGTNNPVTSAAHGEGSDENWTLVAKGKLELPDDRLTEMTIPIPATAAFTSWRLVFPTVKNNTTANSMQIADVQFLTTGGVPFLDVGDPILPFQLLSSVSASPAAELVANAIDQDTGTKYLNFGRENSGFIVTPSAGPAAVTGFTMITANDSIERDPARWELAGTNEEILSGDHGEGNLEAWTVVATGELNLPEDRLTEGSPVTFANSTAYSSYRFRVISVRDQAGANSMQFSEIQFDASLSVPVPGFLITNITTTGKPPTSATLTWASEAGSSYTIQTSPDLKAPWTGQGTFTATGSSTTQTVALTGSLAGRASLFFRILRN